MGREMCRAFAAQGDRVVVASRKAPACEAVAAELRDEFGASALGVGAHVGRWADCDALVDRVLDEFGRIDVLVNNAGMSPLYPSLDLPYATAKAGLNALTVGLARAYAPTVRVNTVMPGPFRADIAQSWPPEVLKRLEDGAIPLRRAGEAEEVVGAALYLTGPSASYTTGSTIKIDGGLTWST